MIAPFLLLQRVYHVAKIHSRKEIVMTSRCILVVSLLLSLALILVIHTQPETVGASSAQGQTFYVLCASETSSSIVYFTPLFTARFNPLVALDTQPMANEFNEYLKGRYDYKTNSNYPGGCPLFETQALASSAKQKMESEVRQRNGQIVEAPWNYMQEAIQPGNTGQHTTRPSLSPQPDHIFCESQMSQPTLYYSSPQNATAPVSISLWNRSFSQYLSQKYSFKGQVNCYMATLERAQRLLNSNKDGARAGNKRVVETDWQYDADVATNQAPVRPDVDEDREPAKNLQLAKPINLQARDVAIKERPTALAFCVKDRMMNGPFDCGCLAGLIGHFRIDHPADTLGANPTPLATLFEGDQFNCASCITGFRAKIWAESQARIAHLQQPAAKCAAEKFFPLLQAKPYPAHVKELVDDAINACR